MFYHAEWRNMKHVVGRRVFNKGDVTSPPRDDGRTAVAKATLLFQYQIDSAPPFSEKSVAALTFTFSESFHHDFCF